MKIYTGFEIGDGLVSPEKNMIKYVLYYDSKAAVAAKDAEILVLKNAVRIVESQYQSIAEQVRERCATICEQWIHTENAIEAIRTADLTDLQNLVVSSASPGSEDVRATDSADAARYRWLRERREVMNAGYPSFPWTVRVELAPFPTSKAIYANELDAAIDAAIAQTKEQG